MWLKNYLSGMSVQKFHASHVSSSTDPSGQAPVFQIFGNVPEARKLVTKAAVLVLPLLALMVPQVSEASRVITSLPHYENFDTNAYASELVFITQGATHEWRSGPGEGWLNSGAARFTPPTSEGYSGLGSFVELRTHNGDMRQLNVRILIKHGPEYHDNAGVNKLMIFNREAYDGSINSLERRPMVITRAGPSNAWQTYRPCHNTWCYPEETPTDEALQFGSDVGSIRHDEWMSIEFEANLDQGVMNLYVYTQDGAIAGLYMVNPFIDPTDPMTGVFSHIDMIGGYFNYDNILAAAPGNYFYIDELVIDDSYIGPPAGFLEVPKAPDSLIAQ